METWAPHLVQLDARAHFNMTFNSSASRGDVPWTAQNSTRQIIAGLQLQKVQTLRTMNLTVGAFSLAVALLTVHRMVSDARRVAAAQLPLNRSRFSFLQALHPAETFPLVLACGAVIQQIIFISVQSTSLRNILSNQCRGLAMITFPAIFLMGYVNLVFGVEMAMRAFKFERFASRGKWSTTICIGVISFLLLLTWIPTVAWPMYNRCFGSLIWFTVRYELLAIVILSILVFSFLFLAALISIQLMRTADVDPNERIAASRMCYYLLMAALVYTLIMPVQVQAHRKSFNNTLATSRIAEVALFTSGIVIGFFHLFLRANATRMVISPLKDGPPPSPSSRPKRPRIRFFGPSDLEMNISGPIALQGGHRPDSRQGLIDVGPEKNRYDFDPAYFARSDKPLSPGSMKSFGPLDPTKWPLPPHPEPISIVDLEKPKEEIPSLHKRNKSSYSLFPTRAEDVPRLPATVYSPPKSSGDNRISKLALRRQTRRSSLGDTKSTTDLDAFAFLSKPPQLFGNRHGRNQSTDSSATVQIGLRFSVAPATLAAAKCTAANRQNDGVPPIRRDNSDSSVNTLGLPIQSPSTLSSSSANTSVLNFPAPPRAASPQQAIPSPGSQLASPRGKALPPTPRSAIPLGLPARPAPTLSGLRMNPVSPAKINTASPATTPRSATTNTTTRSPTVRSPTARLALGAGTMASSPPPNGWI